MLQFRLERGDDEIKYCQKMKLMQRANLALMRSKRDGVTTSARVEVKTYVTEI
jgi:hypothetical protein